MDYLDIIGNAYSGYFNYLTSEILNPSWHNYFYWLIGLSLLAWMLEVVWPWREKQALIRKDFWLDVFYMFFNFFLFSLIVYNALSEVAVNAFNDFLGLFGVENLIAIEINSWPVWAQLLLLFILVDFIQWNVHRLLHRVPWLWNFHKVHHSVEEMGFAAHLRFHWMETIVYKTIQYIPVAMIGFGLDDFFLVHIVALTIGHLNHSNIPLSYGPFKYILNNPKMHIWHHLKYMPKERPYGMNYGLSLSIWDYLFGTAYVPNNGRDIEIGIPEQDQVPPGFIGQMFMPFKKHDSGQVSQETIFEKIPKKGNSI